MARVGLAVLGLLAAGGLLVALGLWQGLAPPPAPRPPPALLDEGDFQLGFEAEGDATYVALRRAYFESPPLLRSLDRLNALLGLPGDVRVLFAPCPEDRAGWDPGQDASVLCQGLVERFLTDYRPRAEGPRQLDAAVRNSTYVVFHHMLAHALLHAPIPAPAHLSVEEAADELGLLLAASGAREGEAGAIDGAMWSLFQAREAPGNVSNFTVEHGWSQERLTELLCLAYGRAPERHPEVVVSGLLPEDRAGRCPGAYGDLVRAWAPALTDYVKHVEGIELPDSPFWRTP